MVRLDAFYPLLLPELPQCPQPTVDFNLIAVAWEFCNRTSVWHGALDSINAVANQLTYDLDSSESQSEVVRVTKLTINGELLWEDSEFRLPTDRRRVDQYVTRPKYTRDEPPFTLSPGLDAITLIKDLAPATSTTAGIVIEGVMRPSMQATQLPDFLFSQYHQALRFGTLSRLMLMQGAAWANAALGMVYQANWETQLAFAANQGSVGNTRRHLRVKKWG